MKSSSARAASFRAAHLACLIVLSTFWFGCRTATQSSEEPQNPHIQVKSKWPYDQEVLTAIQRRWYDLLERRRTPNGKVVVEFKLRANGTVGQLKVVESTVGGLFEVICQKAIQDPAPFRPWPQEMKDELKSDVREIRFTFYYK